MYSPTTRRLFHFLLVTLFVLLSVNALAQGERSTINGIVTDASGAVVPNAEVTATHIATGVDTKTTTTDAGVYRLSSLAIGT